MKYIVFHRENNKFDDILTDPSIKKEFKTKISYSNHLILGFPEWNETADKITTYIMLKHGDDVVDFKQLVPDRTPIAGQDYVPERKPKV